MDQRGLGRSGMTVSALGLGCMPMGGPMTRGETGTDHLFFLGEVEDDEVVRILHFAVDHGVTFFDTAAAYGAGHSEELLGRAFSGRREQVVIATKFGKRVDEGRRWFGFYDSDDEVIQNIRAECEASLRRLKTDYIDLYQFHLLDFPLKRAGEVRDTLEQLVQEGKIRWYGWSTDDPDRARFFAEGEHCAAVQHHHNVIDDAARMLALCDDCDLGSIARGPLASGFLTGKYTPENLTAQMAKGDFRLQYREQHLNTLERLAAIREILTGGGRTVAQGALAWIWARSPRTVPIPGFRTLAQVENNIKAAAFGPLDETQMRQIDAVLGRGAPV